MTKVIEMKGDQSADLSSDAEHFYKHYWVEGDLISTDSKQRFENIVEIVFPQKPLGKKILEVGVGGEGGILRHLKDDNTVMGVDASRSAMTSSKKFGIEVVILNVDRQALPFDNNSFDYIFSIDVFEHLANPQFVVEEIIRVLNNDGQLFLTTPNPMLHHWPRLFYPSLFEKKNFREFLMSNDLEIIKEANLFNNRYYSIVDDEDMKSWVWGWSCRKINPASNLHFLYGLYFWELRNSYGIRIRTIEAADMFRKSFMIEEENLCKRLFYTLSLIYRFMSGETEEFFKHYNYILVSCSTGKYPDNMKSTFMILLIYCEFLFNGHELFSNNKFLELIKYITKFPNSDSYCEIIKNSIINKYIPDASIIIKVMDAEY